MARPVEIRPNFNNDISYLTRLSTAIDKDGGQPSDWKREVNAHINSLINLMNEANRRKQS